jgi:hypothetical protein
MILLAIGVVIGAGYGLIAAHILTVMNGDPNTTCVRAGLTATFWGPLYVINGIARIRPWSQG